MSKKILSFLRGMGSVLELSPESNRPSLHIDRRPVADRLAQDFKNVGGDFRRGFDSAKEKLGTPEKVEA